MPEITIRISVCDSSISAMIEYLITDRGYKPLWDDPGAGLEFEANVVSLMGQDLTRVECPAWLEKTILDAYDSEIYEAIKENESDY